MEDLLAFDLVATGEVIDLREELLLLSIALLDLVLLHLPHFVHVVLDALEVLEAWRVLELSDLVHQVRQHAIAIVMEQLLQQLVLVVVVVQLDYERVQLLRLLQEHVGQVLLRFDRRQDALAVLRQLRQLLRDHHELLLLVGLLCLRILASVLLLLRHGLLLGREGTVHDKVDYLRLSVLVLGRVCLGGCLGTAHIGQL